MRVTIKILRGLLALLLCLLLAMNLWMLFQQTVLHSATPSVFGWSHYIVTTGSMEPDISPGDLILVKKRGSYQLGDVVTFIDPAGSLVTHRIVGRVEEQFITKGDANNVEDDELLPPQRIVGRLEVVLPGAGGTVSFFRTPLGLLILLAAMALIIKLPDWAGAVKTRTKGKHTL